MSAGGSAHCFCCLEEEGAVGLVKCGCKCKTMCACAPCLWKITSEPKSVSFHNVRCTVCLEFFSDAAVLAGALTSITPAAQAHQVFNFVNKVSYKLSLCHLTLELTVTDSD
jgi:hypothetical protein